MLHRRGVVVVAALFSALAAWEFFLRLFVFAPVTYYIHPVFGYYTPEPGQIGRYSEEGFSRYSFNTLGMRDSEIGPRSKYEYRILVLGDSFTAGLEVNEPKTYVRRLEHNLRCFDGNIRTINGGFSGRSPADYLYFADFYNQTIHPDFVVVQLDAGNFPDGMLNMDHDMWRAVYAEKTGDGFQLKKVQIPPLDPLSTTFPFLNELQQHLAIVAYGHMQWEKLAAALSPQSGASGDLGDFYDAYEEPDADHTDVDRLIEWTIAGLHARFPRMVLVYVPHFNYPNVQSTETAKERKIRQTAEAYHVDFINMRSDFAASFYETQKPLHGFNNTMPGVGHTNVRGHRLIADRLTEYFEEQKSGAF